MLGWVFIAAFQAMKVGDTAPVPGVPLHVGRPVGPPSGGLVGPPSSGGMMVPPVPGTFPPPVPEAPPLPSPDPPLPGVTPPPPLPEVGASEPESTVAGAPVLPQPKVAARPSQRTVSLRSFTRPIDRTRHSLKLGNVPSSRLRQLARHRRLPHVMNSR